MTCHVVEVITGGTSGRGTGERVAGESEVVACTF